MNLSRSQDRIPLTDEEPQVVSATIGPKALSWYCTEPANEYDNDWCSRKAHHCITVGHDNTDGRQFRNYSLDDPEMNGQ